MFDAARWVPALAALGRDDTEHHSFFTARTHISQARPGVMPVPPKVLVVSSALMKVSGPSSVRACSWSRASVAALMSASVVMSSSSRAQRASARLHLLFRFP
jgi:hypothetical protein